MKVIKTNLLVVGSGPAGQKAAIQAAKLGKTVVVIEGNEEVGGVSQNSGTIPSKTLREAVLDLHGRKDVSFSELNVRLHQVLEVQTKHLRKQFERNRIQVVKGTAVFENAHQMAVTDEGEFVCSVQAEKIILATGSIPRNPHHIPFDDTTVLDSTRLLKISKVPKSMVVLGGGVIGSEYASFFAALGTEVTVVDKRERLLPLLDREIGVHFQDALLKIGLRFIGEKEVSMVEKLHDKVEVKFSDGSTLHAEVLLYALGRVANVEKLSLDKVGLELDEKGYIPVNALFQTSLPHIYAVGDVIGGPCLASTSMEQGRLAARHAFQAGTHHFPSFYPLGIYTIPEISSIGYTEEMLQNLGFRYEVGRAYYYEIARNQIAGNAPGMFKILFHTDTLEILGVHIIGRGATEVIHIGQVAMSFNAKIDYFIDQVFNYPTYAEGYRIAALNGFNKVKHKR